MGAAGLLIGHVENFVARTEVLGGVAMAIQTPFHLQLVGLISQWQLIDVAVTRLATYPFIDVDRMAEINEVREIVNAGPDQGLVITEAGADRLKQRSAGPNLRMAVHAGL